MRQKQATADDLRRLGMWLTVEEPQLRQVLDLAVKTVLQVSKADFWDEAKKSDRSVETPFAFAESPDAILTGVIDLLFGHEGRWRIIDYKTDVDSTDLVASYQAQLKMYERALASCGHSRCNQRDPACQRRGRVALSDDVRSRLTPP